MPSARTVISFTRQPVRSCTPLRWAAGQYVMSVLAFAPCAQPLMHEPRLMHGARPSYSCDVTALSDGHQCQPSFSKPAAIVFPLLPSGSGGIVGSWYGYAGSPARPETPIIRSLMAKKGSSVS